MGITKIATNSQNRHYQTLYYGQARAGMHDFVKQMYLSGMIEHILLPGYVGWSPKEGSGIFDSIASIDGLQIEYYKMSRELYINKIDLMDRIRPSKSLVLLVNYFGFRDPDFADILDTLKKNNVWTLEDNAHGFFTWHESERYTTDAVVFSLHKMFPFPDGGSLIVQNKELGNMQLSGEISPISGKNPYEYHIHEIAELRKRNFKNLSELLIEAEHQGVLKSLRSVKDIEHNVPQTYPVELLVGNRDEVYQLMNNDGYGVVSLYHTLIEPLRKDEYIESQYLSKHVLNLPVHQDVDPNQYPRMIDCLVRFCRQTMEKREKHD